MNGNIVVTIGRETGSGGREIGNRLAKRMGVKCYDKELVQLAAKNSGLCQEILESQDEKPNKSFLYSLVMDPYGFAANSYMELPLNHKIFLAQFEAIKKLAMEESCVIVGRCADYALADFPNTTSVFIYGDMDEKIKAMCERYEKTPAQAKDVINKIDKKRSSYYNYYSGKKWGDAKSYDLCINSSHLGYDGVVETILKYLEEKKKYMNEK